MRVIPGLLCLVAATACNKATTEAEDQLTGSVVADASTFQPGNVVIRAGGTVEFTFGSTAHDVTFTEQPGRPENIVRVGNTIETRIFPTAGTYSYKCSLTADHGVMEGIVTVRPLTSPAPAP